MLSRVHHIDVRTPDLEGTVAYLESLGLRVVRRLGGDRGSVELALPGDGQVVFEVRPAPDAGQAFVHHVAFELGGRDDLDELRRSGVAFVGDSRYVDATGRTVTNGVDPGGMRWQLTD